MGIQFEAYVECDRCGREEDVEVVDTSIRGEATARVSSNNLPEGWVYDGLYLCEECAEEEDDDDDKEDCPSCGVLVYDWDIHECDECGEEYCDSCGHDCESETGPDPIFDEEE